MVSERALLSPSLPPLFAAERMDPFRRANSCLLPFPLWRQLARYFFFLREVPVGREGLDPPALRDCSLSIKVTPHVAERTSRSSRSEIEVGWSEAVFTSRADRPTDPLSSELGLSTLAFCPLLLLSSFCLSKKMSRKPNGWKESWQVIHGQSPNLCGNFEHWTIPVKTLKYYKNYRVFLDSGPKCKAISRILRPSQGI